MRAERDSVRKEQEILNRELQQLQQEYRAELKKTKLLEVCTRINYVYNDMVFAYTLNPASRPSLMMIVHNVRKPSASKSEGTIALLPMRMIDFRRT